jgi:hypothetical protein
MKAILEFDLPEDQQEFQLANEAADWHSVVWEVDQMLRQHLKYGHELKSADEALEQIRKFLYEEMKDRNLQLY